ncbi:MAG: hypothetical protein MAG795_00028 [Candidatus Woesearchaeota archaeon]|nr:hypothetical protein [Candidatus Woesearchaeota archaeon]
MPKEKSKNEYKSAIDVWLTTLTSSILVIIVSLLFRKINSYLDPNKIGVWIIGIIVGLVLFLFASYNLVKLKRKNK